MLSILLTGVFPFGARAFTLEDLKGLLANHEISTMDDLLGLLPESLRRHFVLVHTSESSQDASFESPRVIMHGENSELILAFNGNPSQKGYNKLEIISYPKGQKSPEFAELNFATGKPRFSENVTGCYECHGKKNPRWKWDPYNFWAGVFGGRDDYRFGGRLNYVHATHEGKKLSAFALARKNLDRYRHLLPANDDLLAHYPVAQPNFEFGRQLSKVNARRIHEMLAAHPGYESFQFALVAALLDADGISGFVPVTRQFTNRSYMRLFLEYKKSARQTWNRIKQANWNDQSGVPFDGEPNFVRYGLQDLETRRTSKLRYIAEQTMGLEAIDFAITLTPSYVFTDGESAIDQILALEVEHLLLRRPDLRETLSFLEDVRAGYRDRDAAFELYRGQDLHGNLPEILHPVRLKYREAIKKLHRESKRALGYLRLRPEAKGACEKVLTDEE